MMRTSVGISIAMGVSSNCFFVSWTAAGGDEVGNPEEVRGPPACCRKKLLLGCSAVIGVLDQPADIGAIEGARVPVRVGDRLIGGEVDPVLRHAEFPQRHRRAD